MDLNTNETNVLREDGEGKEKNRLDYLEIESFP